MSELVFDCPTSANDTGAYKLEWRGAGESATYRLVERDASGERVIYEGPDLASTVTGRAEGVHGYRLEVVGGTAAATCEVEVSPPPLSLAFGLFGLGLVICLATVGLIVRGHRRHRRGELG